MFKREHHDGIYMVLPYFISVIIPNVSNKDYFLKLDEGIQTGYKLPYLDEKILWSIFVYEAIFW